MPFSIKTCCVCTLRCWTLRPFEETNCKCTAIRSLNFGRIPVLLQCEHASIQRPYRMWIRPWFAVYKKVASVAATCSVWHRREILFSASIAEQWTPVSLELEKNDFPCWTNENIDKVCLFCSSGWSLECTCCWKWLLHAWQKGGKEGQRISHGLAPSCKMLQRWKQT